MKGVSIVWDRKLLWLEQTLILFALAGAVYGWLALPVATVWHLAMHLVVGGALVALVVLAGVLARRALGPPRWRMPALLAPLGLALLVAAGAPYLLLNWVPEFGSLAAQAASAAARFVLAALLVSGALLWLWGNATDERR